MCANVHGYYHPEIHPNVLYSITNRDLLMECSALLLGTIEPERRRDLIPLNVYVERSSRCCDLILD